MSPFYGDNYDVGLVPCTSKKRADGVTPISLYTGTPFTVAMRHAQQRCRTVLVMSAKYGLLRLDDPVRYYDAYLPDLGARERDALIYRIRSKPWVELYAGKRILSYLPKAYFELLAEAKPALAATIQRPYKRLPSLTLMSVLSAETKNYGKNPAMR